MAARPYWRGQIRLAPVSIPVEIYSATKRGAAVAFHQIYEPTGQRIKYEKAVPGIGPVDVPRAELSASVRARLSSAAAGSELIGSLLRVHVHVIDEMGFCFESGKPRQSIEIRKQ